MTPPIQPTPAPNVELELAKLANDAMASGADPHDVTGKLHQTISYLRQFPKMAEHATNALADGVASPADISRTLWPHVQAMQHANGAPGVSNAPTPEEAGDGSDSKVGAFGRSLAATGANVAAGIPGMEAVEAGARSVVRGQPYREALGDIRGETSKIPTALRVGERVAGSLPVAAMLPGGAAASGALIGGADEALNADPDQSLGERAARTALGAGVGAVAGKLTDAAVTGGRALLAKNPASLLLQKQAERAASAKQLYSAALGEGRIHEATPAIHAYLQDPDVQEIVAGLQGTAALRGKAPDSPEMLDAIYKTFSDQAAQAKKGLDALTPNKPNIGRFRLSDIKAKQQGLLDAMQSPGVKPPLHLDIPGELHEVEPSIIPEREPLSGPVSSRPLASNTTAPNPTLSQSLRNFQGNTPNEMQGPGGPAFQLGRQPQQVRPGISVSTPPMRVQTVPEKPVQAMMPTYPHAVDDFAKRSSEIEAIQKGYDALRSSLSNGLPTAKNLTRKTPQAFAEWAKSATPEQVQASRQGILGGAKMATSLHLNPFRTLKPASKAAGLLRDASTTPQAYQELLQNLGLLEAGNQITSP